MPDQQVRTHLLKSNSYLDWFLNEILLESCYNQ